MGKIESSWRKRQFGLLKAIIVFLTLLYGVIFFNSLKELFADNDNKVIIGTKSFTEQYILGDILKKMIQGKTSMEVDLRKSLGSNLLFDALKNDQIDIYISYSFITS